MNLYYISQTENEEYDTFSDAVVAAETAIEAANTHPSGNPENWKRETDGSFSGTWVKTADSVSVKLIGTAVQGTPAGVICSSFHAG